MMKKCKYCGDQYLLESFTITSTVKGIVYRRLKCGVCKQKDQRARRRAIKVSVDSYKIDQACAHCGIDDHRVLDFHHVRDKEHTVSDMLLNGFSFDSIMKEVDKCIVLCANCHRIHHYE